MQRTYTLPPLAGSEEELAAFQKHLPRYAPRGGMAVKVEGQDCVKIPLTQSKFAIIDMDDYSDIGRFRWCAHLKNGAWYVTHAESGKQVPLHRRLMGHPESEVDHRNRDGLDNRKSNLRVATPTQNRRNMGRRKNNKSGFIGVSWSKAAGKWVAQISTSRRTVCLGFFAKAKDAAAAYDEAARRKDADFCCVNAGATDSTGQTEPKA